ncbi:speedy protein E4 [Ictidomys tridecemlineatus]|uniref:speedy protein E4-like n=1 Tax=Ictidomys tridecemlineatus TaxID=43179 RepID=UPI001A9F9C1A|nr:speedy protein E4-like [Ictidomys tridecemlineatus]
MADQEISQSGQSPSQPSTSGTHLEVVVDDEVPGPSALWVKPCLPCRKREWTSESEGDSEDDPPGIFDSALWVESGLLPETTGIKRKRESSTESEDELEDLESGLNHPWDVESLCGLKMKLKKRRMNLVQPEHHEVFNRLLEDPVVKRFLAWDKNLRVSDKYLLAMVIAYFSRAGLFSWQYQRIHFFLALYLANDMEEDNQAPKQDIFRFLYGKSYAQRPLFHKLRYQFICSMGWNTRVSKEECEEIQAYDPELWVWGRDRTLLA